MSQFAKPTGFFWKKLLSALKGGDLNPQSYIKNGKLKKQVAEEHGIQYHQVQQITKDIDTRYHIPNDVVKKIRRKVEGGIRESS